MLQFFILLGLGLRGEFMRRDLIISVQFK